MRKVICFSLLVLAATGSAILFHHARTRVEFAITSSVSDGSASASSAPADRIPERLRPVAPVRLPKSSSVALPNRRPATTPEKQAAMQTYLRLPLDFEANRGQAPARFKFIARGPGYALGLSP